MTQIGLLDALRVLCGLFFLPHLALKLVSPHEPLEFFRAAKFPAPRLFMSAAAAIEVIVSVGLIFAIQTRVAAWLGAAYLLVASAAVLRVGCRHKWQWFWGGVEYPVFWALVCGLIGLSTPVVP